MSKLPGRNQQGSEGYRYGYQGQFSEEDDETGWNQFELRMWDGRIGRWMSTDPYNEYFSPYVGMANNPIFFTDPDGGCTKCPEDATEGDTFKHDEFGELIYRGRDADGEAIWTGEGLGIILDDAVIGESASYTIKVGATKIPAFKKANHMFIYAINNETLETEILAEGFPERDSPGNWGMLESDIQKDPLNFLDMEFEYNAQLIDIPKGMSSYEFREKIIAGFSSYDNRTKYWATPTRDVSGAVGNSNSLIGSVLRAAGVKDFKPELWSPGYRQNVLPHQRVKYYK